VNASERNLTAFSSIPFMQVGFRASELRGHMPNRFVPTILLGFLLVAVALTARPYVDRLLFAATEPRPVEARGTLADAERTSIDIFQRASPSVVQVVGRTAGAGQAPLGGQRQAATSGSGFVWDAAGHVVTNNHVVEVFKRLWCGSPRGW
jgi:2-alkenal reductase